MFGLPPVRVEGAPLASAGSALEWHQHPASFALSHILSAELKTKDAPCSADEHMNAAITMLLLLCPWYEPTDAEALARLEHARHCSSLYDFSMQKMQALAQAYPMPSAKVPV